MDLTKRGARRNRGQLNLWTGRPAGKSITSSGAISFLAELTAPRNPIDPSRAKEKRISERTRILSSDPRERKLLLSPEGSEIRTERLKLRQYRRGVLRGGGGVGGWGTSSTQALFFCSTGTRGYNQSSKSFFNGAVSYSIKKVVREEKKKKRTTRVMRTATNR